MKFDSLVFVDDDYASNYYHKYTISLLDCCKQIISIDDVDDVRSFLETYIAEKDTSERFSVIFLDINMPKYDGFDLIKRNLQLFKDLKKCNTYIYFLTTSENPTDLEKSLEYDFVKGYIAKPLSKDNLKNVFQDLHSKM